MTFRRFVSKILTCLKSLESMWNMAILFYKLPLKKLSKVEVFHPKMQILREPIHPKPKILDGTSMNVCDGPDL